MSSTVPPHPHGVKPEGNLWLPGVADSARAKRSAGLGALASLDDRCLLRICGFLPPKDLATLCVASDVLGAFASHEDFWRAACVERAGGKPMVPFKGTWKATCLGASARPWTRGVSVFSDVLYQTWELAHGSNGFGAQPSAYHPCERLAQDSGTAGPAFSAEYEAGLGRPVVFEGGGASAAADAIWDQETLVKQVGDRILHSGGVNFRLHDYLDYAQSNTDDQPLYLFDPTFSQSCPELGAAYEAPTYFKDDLFDLLDKKSADMDGRLDSPASGSIGGSGTKKISAAAQKPGGGADSRPDYRWLLIGGLRSGQSWHKDPNNTSAWNLTLRGRKRWLFFPPHVCPPGVQRTGDIEDDDYVTPICLAEWGRSFYGQCLTTPGFVECETGPGEVMYVPRGWWHMVLNVAPLTVAVSHHFLSPAGLHTTLKLLRDKPHQVSGIDRGLARDKAADKTTNETAEAEEDSDHARRSAAGTALLNRLMVELQEKRPEALADAEARLQEEARRADERLQEELRRSKKKSAWRALVAEGGAGGSSDDKGGEVAAAPASFSFGFG